MDVINSEKTAMCLAVSRFLNLKEQQQINGHYVYVNLRACKRKQDRCCYVFTQTAKLALCQGRSKLSLILTSKLQRDLHRTKEGEQRENNMKGGRSEMMQLRSKSRKLIFKTQASGVLSAL